MLNHFDITIKEIENLEIQLLSEKNESLKKLILSQLLV